MTKNIVYRYFGRNGNVTTPVLLEGATPIKMYRLIADSGKLLTDGSQYVHMIDVFDDEVELWYEVPERIA